MCEQTKSYLTELLTLNNRIYWILMRRSSSGMTRHIKVFCAREGEIIDISFEVSKLIGYNIDKESRTIKIRGCGFCPGDSIRYDLSATLFDGSAKLKAERL